MISTAEADALIAGQLPPNPETETLPLARAPRRVLAETIYAQRDHPPFHRVAMDGAALVWAEVEAGRSLFPIAGLQAAGSPPLSLEDPGAAVEVMTGAVLPRGADTVIPFEDLERTPQGFLLRPRGLGEESPREQASLRGQGRPQGKLKARGNIHRRGEDYREGDTLLEPGRLLLPPHLHLLATEGYARVTVRSRARCALAATGDELVPVEARPLDHQIRRSNTPAIQAEAASWGLGPFTEDWLPDDPRSLRRGLEKMLKDHDVLILSGGVSMGRFDVVPPALAELGVREIFHRVRQKPGKPLWFGRGPEGQVVFGLPGNPVSSLFCFRRYVLPFLLAWEGRNTGDGTAPVEGLEPGLKDLVHFVPVRRDGSLLRALPARGSGNFHQLVEAAGFVQVPAGFSPGERVELPFFPWGGER